MNRLLLSLAMFLLYAMTAQSNVTDGNMIVRNKPTLKVLDIGNSYTDDATGLLPAITKASGSDVSTMCLYKATRGGASFKNWCDIYHDKDSTTTYSVSKVLGGLQANVTTGTGGKGDGSLFRALLTEEQWDVIIIHQYSVYAPYFEQWTGNGKGGSLDELLSIIKSLQPDAVIGFYIVHSYWDHYSGNQEGSSYERWRQICRSVKKLQLKYGIDFIIPYGTAVENIRASSLNNEYDLTRDGTHCGYGLCRYTAACCYYETLIAPRSGISVLGNTARYDASSAPEGTKYPAVSVTDENARVAQVAAITATEHMFECINPETNTTVEDDVLGDVNGDGSVDVADIAVIISIMASRKNL